MNKWKFGDTLRLLEDVHFSLGAWGTKGMHCTVVEIISEDSTRVMRGDFDFMGISNYKLAFVETPPVHEVLNRIRKFNEEINETTNSLYQKVWDIGKHFTPLQEEALKKFILSLDMEWSLCFYNNRIFLSGRDLTQDEMSYINSVASSPIGYHWSHDISDKLQLTWDDNETGIRSLNSEDTVSMVEFIVNNKIKCDTKHLDDQIRGVNTTLKALEKLRDSIIVKE